MKRFNPAKVFVLFMLAFALGACTSDTEDEQQALVDNANASAKRFAAEGAHCILLARTVGGLEETDDAIRTAGHPAATLVPLDLRDFDKIDQLGASLYEALTLQRPFDRPRRCAAVPQRTPR